MDLLFPPRPQTEPTYVVLLLPSYPPLVAKVRTALVLQTGTTKVNLVLIPMRLGGEVFTCTPCMVRCGYGAQQCILHMTLRHKHLGEQLADNANSTHRS